ncbi:MAG TPA: RluA family pseudouridine synthase, partial [Candidatus Glassbacteria bacterium]|nr:RluA family pseudouridine synthase [Candidatus Glassbacteria bacterium]
MRKHFAISKADRGQRLDLFLAAKLPELSRSRIQQLLAGGRVSIEEAAALPLFKAGYRLRGGERITITVEPPAPLRALPEALPLDILYEDEDLVAVNKPAGMVMHLGAGVKSGTLVNALVHHFGELSRLGGEARPGIVHRLDKHTSGVVLVAKNDAIHRELAKKFAKRVVEKHYRALVHGSPRKAEGVIREAIGRDPKRRTRMATRLRGGRPAVSIYQVLRRYKGCTLMDVRILTGRTHQVRVHCASIGHPVVGDKLYGAPGRLSVDLFQTLPTMEVRQPTVASRSAGKPPPLVQVPTLARNFLHSERIRFS